MRVLDHLAVLVPQAQSVAIYVRSFADTRLRFAHNAQDVATLHDAISELPRPRIVAFVGSGYHGYLEALLRDEKTAVCLIPGAWVRHIPPQHDTQRARFAVQLLEAHVNEPIQLLHSTQHLPL